MDNISEIKGLKWIQAAGVFILLTISISCDSPRVDTSSENVLDFFDTQWETPDPVVTEAPETYLNKNSGGDFDLFEFEGEDNSGLSKTADQPVTPPVPSSTVSKQGYQWPVKGSVIQGFSPYRNMDGILIRSANGRSVYAAKEGVVIFRGYVAGLGNVVVIEHRFGYLTLYGHLSHVSVDCNDKVGRGHVIGGIGTSGNVSSAALHFRIYADYRLKNPMEFLPLQGKE